MSQMLGKTWLQLLFDRWQESLLWLIPAIHLAYLWQGWFIIPGIQFVIDESVHIVISLMYISFTSFHIVLLVFYVFGQISTCVHDRWDLLSWVRLWVRIKVFYGLQPLRLSMLSWLVKLVLMLSFLHELSNELTCSLDLVVHGFAHSCPISLPSQLLFTGDRPGCNT